MKCRRESRVLPEIGAQRCREVTGARRRRKYRLTIDPIGARYEPKKLAFFAKLPNPDKHFAVMPGISHASFQQKNYALVYHILWSFFAQPAPIYRG